MFRGKAKVAIIIGAGFSKNAGIPLQSEFSNMILSINFNNLDMAITNVIKDFLKKIFFWEEGNKLPTLEDMFTMIDLSSATGHNLGRSYTPKMLRGLRRMLIYRCFQILDFRFNYSNEIEQLLTYFLTKDNGIFTTHFVVLNWDIVLERQLEAVHNNPLIDYCIQAIPWGSNYGSNPPLSIAKVHGSSNWVYCDNCRSVFYNRDKKLSLTIKAGLIKSDFRLFNESFSDNIFEEEIQLPPSERECRNCKCSVGPHIATFSFKKSFRTHAFSSSWMGAEQILDQADYWIFIGYSLPDADYEFKHLLKSSQLKLVRSRKYPKQIDVVLLKDDKAQIRYETLFGMGKINIFQGGLSEYIKYS